ncbi:flagellar biosynthesis protein FliA [Paucibacter sp. KBW04]|uniref:sigma-70 family RNA polymerase sigma factor n=1 Tax=Paucibacter sp. KBW04 TaxID=2153361 RepID=UPI000FC02D61|nr:sigma-70 family RNA polymerase sigma factor [Paucibacter sp. KBW04]RQO63602.1 flagellar biosynthesis protein FliA [Paucibacter sp. KBW04]
MESRAPSARDSLVSHYSRLVRILAAKCYSHRVANELEFGDYFQFGMVGLLESIDRFDPAIGVKFETFAGHRIQGAILNGVESLSEVQKQVAVRRRVLKERQSSLALDTEDAALSTLEQLASLAIGLAIGFVLEDSSLYLEDSERAEADNSYGRIEMRQLCRRLSDCVAELGGNQQIVIYRHYFQNQSFDDIAGALQVSKGRVAQIHKSAIAELRRLQGRYRLMELRA